MKRVIASLMMLMILSIVAACAAGDYAIDEPYAYPVDTQSEEWDALTPRERREVFSIPQEIIDDMTTQALLISVLNNPFLSDAWAYSTGEQMVEVAVGLNGAHGIDGVAELMERDDIQEELQWAKKRYSDDVYSNRVDLLIFIYEHYVLGFPYPY